MNNPHKLPSIAWTYVGLGILIASPFISVLSTLLGIVLFFSWLVTSRKFPINEVPGIKPFVLASLGYFFVHVLLVLNNGITSWDLTAIFSFSQFLYLGLIMPFLVMAMRPFSILFLSRLAIGITLLAFLLAAVDQIWLLDSRKGIWVDIPWKEQGQWWAGITPHLRTSLMTGNPNTFATLLFPFIFLGLMSWREKSTIEKSLAVVAILLGLAATYLFAGNRISLVAAPVLLALVMLYLWKIDRRFFFSLVVFGLLGVTALALFLGLGFDNDLMKRVVSRIYGMINELLGNSGADNSVGMRMIMLKASWLAFLDAPILGHGPQNVFSALRPYFDGSIMQNVTFRTPHNIFASHLVGGGIVSLVAFLMLACTPLLAAYRLLGNYHGIDVLYGVAVVTSSLFALGMAEAMFFNDQKNTLYLLLWLLVLKSGLHSKVT